MRAISRKNLWERTPLSVKRGIGWVISHIPPQWLLGRRFRSHLAFAQAVDHWSADETRAEQLYRLRRILTLASQKSPYYRRVFKAIGFDIRELKSPEDIADLPLIDKSTIRAHGREMMTTLPGSAGVDFVSTGGSSGQPLGFHIGADRSAVEYAYLVAGWQRVGYTPESVQAVFRGQVVSPDATGLRHEYDPILRRHAYSNFHMSDAEIWRYLTHISTIGPCFLHVYPSSIAAITRFLVQSGQEAPRNVRGILAGSEMVHAADRDATERLWGVRYFSWYGHSEKLVLAAECEHSNDYHVWPTYGHFELLDEHGRPVTTQGQVGEIVGTGFINTVTPFIRYRTGDYATYVGNTCSHCGRHMPIIRDIQGHRTQELLVAIDGSLIAWTAINMHDETFNAVRQFQFRQHTPGCATLRVVPWTKLTDVQLHRMRRNLERKLAGRIHFDIEPCETIELTQRGKSTYVDQRIDLETYLSGKTETHTACEVR
ncbi:MAG: phenylacetate--CoA ligase family protein [Phycisphaerae bacterium]|nr:phenylacetate--CoA ligase family protein [Phycisphaerae bacterium]